MTHQEVKNEEKLTIKDAKKAMIIEKERKRIEKKLAKRYNVEYPFKTNKTKKPTPNENPVQQQPVKNTGNTQPTQPKKEQPKQEEKERRFGT